MTQFAQGLADTGLVTAEDLSTAHGKLAAEQRDDPQALARELIASGHLTKFQASNALQGRANGLVYA